MTQIYDDMASFVSISSSMEVAMEHGRATNEWSEVFNIVFKTLKPQLPKTLPGVDWCDPDTTYQDDVMAFVNAVKERAQVYASILNAAGNPLKPGAVEILSSTRDALRTMRIDHLSNDQKQDMIKGVFLPKLVSSNVNAEVSEDASELLDKNSIEIEDVERLAKKIISHLMELEL